MRADSLPLSDARRLLGLSGSAGPQALSAAFRAAVKAARPDQPGGDAERFRQVIAAYRLLQAETPALPAPRHAPSPTAWTPPVVVARPPLVVLTPMQALVAATGAAARVMRLDATLGTLEPGKQADLLVLGGNPADDIRNTRKLEQVWIAGQRLVE